MYRKKNENVTNYIKLQLGGVDPNYINQSRKKRFKHTKNIGISLISTK